MELASIKAFVLDLLQAYGWRVLWILVLFFLGRGVLKRIIKRMVRLADDGDPETDSSVEQRAGTLGQVLNATGKVVIYIVILLMVLDLFGVDIRPVLAGAGVIGLAIGFGAQSLVRDFVSGLFVLLENQYAIGDRVKIGSSEGEVVKITMRSTVLKDEEGKMYFISNGSVNNVINLSRKG